jgi:hypothetical protein
VGWRLLLLLMKTEVRVGAARTEGRVKAGAHGGSSSSPTPMRFLTPYFLLSFHALQLYPVSTLYRRWAQLVENKGKPRRLIELTIRML